MCLYIQYSHHKVRKVYKIDATDTNNVDRIILVLLHTQAHGYFAMSIELKRNVETEPREAATATPTAAQSAKTERMELNYTTVSLDE